MALLTRERPLPRLSRSKHLNPAVAAELLVGGRLLGGIYALMASGLDLVFGGMFQGEARALLGNPAAKRPFLGQAEPAAAAVAG